MYIYIFFNIYVCVYVDSISTTDCTIRICAGHNKQSHLDIPALYSFLLIFSLRFFFFLFSFYLVNYGTGREQVKKVNVS